MSEINIPLAEVVEHIRAFETAPVEAQIDTIRTLVRSHKILSLEWGQGWRYRRARILEPDQMVDHVDDLIWRKDMPAKIGRANAVGFGVLYLGDRRDTALSEVGAVDDDVVVSEFVIRPDRSTRVAPLGEMIQVQRTGRGFLAGNVSDEITKMMNAMEPSAAKAVLITDAFLLDVLTKADDDYTLSSAVAMAIYEKLPAVAAIAFPSRRQYGALNFAVRIEGFWGSWGVVAAQHAHARHLALGFYNVADARDVTGIYNDGTLKWSEVVDPTPTGVMKLDPPWFDLSATALETTP
jgi:hypothetical protein